MITTPQPEADAAFEARLRMGERGVVVFSEIRVGRRHCAFYYIYADEDQQVLVAEIRRYAGANKWILKGVGLCRHHRMDLHTYNNYRDFIFTWLAVSYGPARVHAAHPEPWGGYNIRDPF